MIFVVTGTQLPFDRLIKMLDEIAPQLDEEIVAQVNGSQYLPHHVNTIDILPPDEFDKLFKRARLIVAHAGIGTIISANKMKEAGWVYVATEKEELQSLLSRSDLHPLCSIGNGASESLVKSITEFIEQ